MTMPPFPSPFRVPTDKPVVAVSGARHGYLMIASTQEVFRYEDIPDAVFAAARAWAEALESMGALRVYWLVLSEVTLHYHIHIFPRWQQDELKGIPLFETRENEGQPAWEKQTLTKLQEWSDLFNVELV